MSPTKIFPKLKLNWQFTFLRGWQCTSFRHLSTCKVFDIICISAPMTCCVYVTAYSMKGVEMFVLLSNMRAEFIFVYSRHQTDVWDKEQNAAVPRGVCNNPFQTFRLQACKKLHKPVVSISESSKQGSLLMQFGLTVCLITTNAYELRTSMALQLQSWGWELCSAIINIAQ